jgi:hypothetical protein
VLPCGPEWAQTNSEAIRKARVAGGEPSIVIHRFAIGVACVVALSASGLGERARGRQQPTPTGAPGPSAAHYRVNYRPSARDPWQLYSEVRSLDKANQIATDLRQSGYQSEVVNDLNPSPQPFPDAAQTSASGYYPTSNWAADYNYYLVPGGRYNNYGWFGGWNPGYGYRVYSGYANNGGSNWHSGFWRGHNWNRGWNRGWNGAGWWGGGGWNGGGGWSGSHRNWNNSHSGRGSHESSHEHHSRQAHHSSHTHHAAAGHHSAGHHAAAHHASHSSADHRGTGHHAAGGRTGGRQTSHHAAGGHAARGHSRGGHHGGNHSSAGRHAGGHSGRHHDP